jgi:hypothetical protein
VKNSNHVSGLLQKQFDFVEPMKISKETSGPLGPILRSTPQRISYVIRQNLNQSEKYF